MSREKTEKVKAGGKNIPLIIYLSFFVLYAVVGIFPTTITLESEYSGVASAAAFLGRDWFSAMLPVSDAGKFLLGIIYVPVMVVCPDPFWQFRLFMLAGSALYAVIPLAAYKLAGHFFIHKTWQKAAAAVACGVYPTVVINAHMMSAASLAPIMVWLLMLIIFRKEKQPDKKSASVLFMSLLAGLITAIACFMYFPCIVLFIGTIAALLLLRKNGARPIYISVYTITFILAVALDTVMTLLISGAGLYSFDSRIFPFSAQGLSGGFSEFITNIGGRIYYFIVSSWGLGAISLILCAVAVFRFVRYRKRTPYNVYIIAGCIFCIVTAMLMVFADSFYALKDAAASQDDIISGGAAFAVITPVILMLFAHLFTYGINYIQLMAAVAAVAGMSFVSLLLVSPALGGLDKPDPLQTAELCALRLGVAAGTPFGQDNVIYPVCLLFVVLAAMIPTICCAKKHASEIITYICIALISFSAVYASYTAINEYTSQGRGYSDAAVEINSFIESYSGAESAAAQNTTIVVYGADRKLAMDLQYFNQSSTVKYISGGYFPSDCYIISSGMINTRELCVLIGRSGDINVYAVGQAAVGVQQPAAPPTEEAQQ